MTPKQVGEASALPSAPPGWATLASDYALHPLVEQSSSQQERDAIFFQGLLAWLEDSGCSVEASRDISCLFPSILGPLGHSSRRR